MDPITASVLVGVAVIAAIAPIFVAWDTRQNKKMLTTSNGTTTAQYTEQSHALLLSLDAKLDAHISNEAIHARS